MTKRTDTLSRLKGDPAVTLQWSEWHGMREDLKEAKRLLNMVLAASGKGQPIDRGQIEGFLNEPD